MIPMISHDIPWCPAGSITTRSLSAVTAAAPGRTASAALPQEIVLPPLLSSPRQNLLKYLVSNCKISPQPTVQCVESKPLSGTRHHPFSSLTIIYAGGDTAAAQAAEAGAGETQTKFFSRIQFCGRPPVFLHSGVQPGLGC